MNLTIQRSNEEAIIDWFENHSKLSSKEYSILLNILYENKGQVDIFFCMNEVLDNERGEYKNNSLGINFTKQGDVYLLTTQYGQLGLDYYEYKAVISKIVDIYCDVLPLGTVIDLEKEDFKEIIPLEDDGEFRIIITDRLVPFTEETFFFYSGNIYPVGNIGENVVTVYFTPSMIKNVVHMGFSDDDDINYITAMKMELLFNNNMHSTCVLKKEEMQKINKGTINN